MKQRIYRVEFEAKAKGCEYFWDRRDVVAGADAMEAIENVRKQLSKDGYDKFRLMSVQVMAETD